MKSIFNVAWDNRSLPPSCGERSWCERLAAERHPKREAKLHRRSHSKRGSHFQVKQTLLSCSHSSVAQQQSAGLISREIMVQIHAEGPIHCRGSSTAEPSRGKRQFMVLPCRGAERFAEWRNPNVECRTSCRQVLFVMGHSVICHFTPSLRSSKAEQPVDNRPTEARYLAEGPFHFHRWVA